MLPGGSSFTGAYDVGRTDLYGRELMYVATPSNADVGLTLLSEGLATVMYVAPNGARKAQYETAEAQSTGREIGLHSLGIECTEPAQALAAAAKAQAAAAEQTRIAREQAAQAASAAAAEQARIAQEQAAARAAAGKQVTIEKIAPAQKTPGAKRQGAPQAKPTSPPRIETPTPKPPSTGGRAPCRHYGPNGTSFDEKGRRYTALQPGQPGCPV